MAYNKTDQSLKIGQYVKEYLKKNGISTSEAARRLGVKAPFVSMHLNGRPFSVNQAERWAREFGLDKEFLTSGKGLVSKVELVALSPEEQQIIADIRSGRLKVDMLPPQHSVMRHVRKAVLKKKHPPGTSSMITHAIPTMDVDSSNWVMDSSEGGHWKQ